MGLGFEVLVVGVQYRVRIGKNLGVSGGGVGHCMRKWGKVE